MSVLRSVILQFIKFGIFFQVKNLIHVSISWYTSVTVILKLIFLFKLFVSTVVEIFPP